MYLRLINSKRGDLIQIKVKILKILQNEEQSHFKIIRGYKNKTFKITKILSVSLKTYFHDLKHSLKFYTLFYSHLGDDLVLLRLESIEILTYP